MSGRCQFVFEKWKSYRCRIFLVVVVLLSVWYYFALPDPLFQDPTSTVILSREGHLMGARIATDGQWRFPEMDLVPEKFEKSLLAFEDQYFYYHPGVNPVALLRATRQNLGAGRVVSGGSTLSMQLIRIARKGKSRSLYQKMVEMIQATRLELGYSKKEILALYASHAPFGGNVVGLEAAAWRYFGRGAQELSWAEAATLAVLPNAPALIYPGKNNIQLEQKRNRLLERLQQQGVIDSLTCALSKMEAIPGKIHSLPSLAPHLLDRVGQEHVGERIRTSLQQQLQVQVQQIVKRHQVQLEANQIHNAAVLVLDVETGQALAYVGNTSPFGQDWHGNQVDVIQAPRSTGSILKPLLFAAMLNDGDLLPYTLVPDVPTQIAGYSPKNYSLQYDGAVPAQIALARSLNVPAVRMLRDFGVDRFHDLLKKLGMTTLNRPAGHYGLSLILGGAEGTLWDITGIYASFSRVLNHYPVFDGTYDPSDIRQPVYQMVDGKPNRKEEEHGLLDAAPIYQTMEALLEVNRPDSENGWKSFSSSNRIAWKTGTSFGFRDAWAVGTTSRYVVGVWVGNADGEGRPGLTGVGVAAPILFDVFDLLPQSPWFEQPVEEMERVPVCRWSGCRAGRWCEPVDTVWVSRAGLRTGICPYHQLVHLDASGRYRVNSDCESVSRMQHRSWFVLPPVMEWYFKQRNPLYRPLPPLREDCAGHAGQGIMEFIYPRESNRIFVPVELNGARGKAVFEVAHHDPTATIYWHLDGEYLGSTCQIHQMELSPDEGEHNLTLVDEAGHALHKRFTIVGKEEKQLGG